MKKTKPIDYLFENFQPGGTYSSLLPSVESKEQLYLFCAKAGIENLVDSDEYHCTLIYSKNPCPTISSEDYGLPCQAIPVEFRVLGTDSPVLVLEVYCPDAVNLHSRFRLKHGATHDYPEYIPHITVAKNFQGEVPKEIPEFDIEFTGFNIMELD